MIPTIEWCDGTIRMLDQRKLPARIEWYVCRGYRDVITAIQKMVIRGAPAIGVAAAMGLALGARFIRAATYPSFQARFQAMAKAMATARPTAVNLRWAVERMSRLVEESAQEAIPNIKAALETECLAILAEDVAANRRMGEIGQALIADGAVVLTHCNAGSLATGGYGTALGVIRAAHEHGKRVSVIADETRPWLQGLRLTAFELMQDQIPVTVIADNAAGYLMQRGEVDLVITGADRIAANGDVANKIGTYQVALLAKAHAIPFYVAAPVSTIDPAISRGNLIPVEERDPSEICRIGGRRLAPRGLQARNPAFDITPARLVSAIITEKGIVRPPYTRGIRKLLQNS